MRVSILPLIAGLTLAAAATSSGAADIPTLEASADAGACGGSVGCSNPMDTEKSPATNTDVATAMDASTLADGSYADAKATATFGALHIYADAYRASGSDAQSHATAKTDDYISAANLQGVVNESFVVNGSIAPGGADFGNVSQAYFHSLSYDDVTGKVLDNTTWETTEANPTAVVDVSYAVPVGHGVESIVIFTAFAYSSYGVVDYVDYANTLNVYMTTGASGLHVAGLSGHDYTPPSAAPEPAAWAMMLVGFGLAGGALRRRSRASVA